MPIDISAKQPLTKCVESQLYPYVGITQIRLWVRKYASALSLPTQAPLLSYRLFVQRITLDYTPFFFFYK